LEWLTQRFELSRGGAARNVRPMEGLRGFAVFLVFLVHYSTLVKPWIAEEPALLAVSNALRTIGTTGVDLFFVLSGYLIYSLLISRPQQFVRFYPAFVAVFIVYVVLSFAFPAESKIPGTAFEGLIYLAKNFFLLPGLFPIDPMISVAWSLSYEMFYYLAIPLVVQLFRLRKVRSAWRAVFFSTFAAATTIYCAAYGGHVRLVMFVSGILLYEAMNSRHVPTPNGCLGLLVLALGLLATLLPISGSGGGALKVGILFVSFFILCLACFRNPSASLPGMFSWTPLRWLGNMSYSFYLLHGLALKAAFAVLAVVLPTASGSSWLFYALLPVMFASTLVPTSILFLAVERPFSLAPRRIMSSVPRAPHDQGPDDTISKVPPS